MNPNYKGRPEQEPRKYSKPSAQFIAKMSDYDLEENMNKLRGAIERLSRENRNTKDLETDYCYYQAQYEFRQRAKAIDAEYRRHLAQMVTPQQVQN